MKRTGPEKYFPGLSYVSTLPFQKQGLPHRKTFMLVQTLSPFDKLSNTAKTNSNTKRIPVFAEETPAPAPACTRKNRRNPHEERRRYRRYR